MAWTFYPNVTDATLQSFLPKLPRFLINNLAGYTGPGDWNVLMAYSSGAASPFDIPTNPKSLDTLAADNSWRLGAPAVGDYIVLRSAGISYPFDLGIEYQAAGTIRFIGCPKTGFDITAHKTDMTDALNWLNPKCSTFDYSASGSANWTIIANSSCFHLLFNPGGTGQCYTYLGHTVNNNDGDYYPFVQYIQETAVYATNSSGFGSATAFQRISNIDEITEIYLRGDFVSAIATAGYTTDLDSNQSALFPVSVCCQTAGHYGTKGELDGVELIDCGRTGVGMVDVQSKSKISFKNYASYPALVLPWDGITSV